MNLTQNRTMARAAINHVKSKLTLGAENNNDNPHQDEAGNALLRMRVDLVEVGGGALYRIAEYARQAKAGNCGEQSALAVEFLKQRGIYPLDLMCLTNGDHGWVVIGRAAGSNPADYTTWGPDACICDPWTPCSQSAAQWGASEEMEDAAYTSFMRIEAPARSTVKSFEAPF